LLVVVYNALKWLLAVFLVGYFGGALTEMPGRCRLEFIDCSRRATMSGDVSFFGALHDGIFPAPKAFLMYCAMIG